MNFDNLLNKNTKILIITSNDFPSYIDRKWIDDLIEFIKFNKSIITGLVLNDTFNYQQTAGLFFFKQLGDVIRDQQLTSITKLDIGNNGEIGNWVVDLWLMRRDIENYLPNLKSLNIENSRITLNHEIILRLQALQTLEVLNLDNNIFYDCELTLNLVLQLPKLRSISIVGNGLNVNYSNHKHILESFFAQLSTKLTMIEYIKLALLHGSNFG